MRLARRRARPFRLVVTDDTTSPVWRRIEKDNLRGAFTRNKKDGLSDSCRRTESLFFCSPLKLLLEMFPSRLIFMIMSQRRRWFTFTATFVSIASPAPTSRLQRSSLQKVHLLIFTLGVCV